MTEIRAIGVAAVGAAFVRSPRYLAEKIADAVDAKAPDVRDERFFWRNVVRVYDLLPGELPALQARIAAKYCRNLDLWQVLPELRRRHKLILVYSGPSTTLACWRGGYRLGDAFDAIVTAVDFGLTARDAALYAKVAQAAGVAADACAMVESTREGFQAAEAGGMHAYRYGSAYGLRRWLAALDACGEAPDPH